jgi:hypothetical protein
MIVILYVLAPYTGIGNLYPYEVLPIRGLHIYILQSADKRQRHLPKELIFQSSSMIRIALGMKNKVMRRQTFVGGISRLYLYIRVRMKAREGGYGGYGEKRREEKRKKKLDFGNASSCCQVPNPKRGRETRPNPQSGTTSTAPSVRRHIPIIHRLSPCIQTTVTNGDGACTHCQSRDNVTSFLGSLTDLLSKWCRTHCPRNDRRTQTVCVPATFPLHKHEAWASSSKPGPSSIPICCPIKNTPSPSSRLCQDQPRNLPLIPSIMAAHLIEEKTCTTAA